MEESTIQPIETNNYSNRHLYIFVAIVISVIIIIYGVNYFQLQSNMNKILREDQRNQGITVSVHYENYINPNNLVYDLKSVSNNNSMADVFRIFLQFSDSVKGKMFDSVILNFNGTPKFKLGGSDFNTIGKEYSSQNPIYTIRAFPEKLKKLDDTQAY